MDPCEREAEVNTEKNGDNVMVEAREKSMR